MPHEKYTSKPLVYDLKPCMVTIMNKYQIVREIVAKLVAAVDGYEEAHIATALVPFLGSFCCTAGEGKTEAALGFLDIIADETAAHIELMIDTKGIPNWDPKS